jgi:iron complex transport system permease protein
MSITRDHPVEAGDTAAARARRDPHSPIAARLAFLALLTAFALALSVSVGAAPLPLGRVLAALTGGADATTRTIVFELRLPRAALAIVAGGGLAVSGAVFQALLRNPLAEPYVLGISGGAAVGGVTVLVLGLGRLVPWVMPVGAFAGAVLAIVLVFRIAVRVGRALDTRVLLLAGVVTGAFFNAVILLLLTIADFESFRSAVFWMMGSLAGASWASLGIVAGYLLPAVAVLFALARPLNLLALGEETALYLGTRVERVKVAAYIVASLAVAATVALCGVIGFIGLIVPHALRLLWGNDHRLLLPGSFLAGGAFLLAADTAARTVASPAELPVGVITALVGVPLFIALLTRPST